MMTLGIYLGCDRLYQDSCNGLDVNQDDTASNHNQDIDYFEDFNYFQASLLTDARI